jgi:hypothetical protein
MKRLVLIGIASLTAGACGIPSGLTTPTASSSGGGTTFTVAATCPSPSGTPLPFVVFGHSTAEGCGTTLPSSITPSFALNPSQGTAPLTVDASMCGSTDSDPLITLHYAASYGDGGPDDGSDKTCQFHHLYPNPGTFPVTECVWDEIPARLPGLCKSFTVTVTAQTNCAVTFQNAMYSCSGGPFGSVVAQALTQGNGACGQPLTVGAFASGAEFGQQSLACPPGGGTCNVSIPLPPAAGLGSFGPTTLQGLNASGSVTIGIFGGC